MRVSLDDDGQPLNPGINRMRVDDRTVCELVGICKGMVADAVKFCVAKMLMLCNMKIPILEDNLLE